VVQPRRRAAHGRGGHDQEHAVDAGRLNALRRRRLGPGVLGHWSRSISAVASARTGWHRFVCQSGAGSRGCIAGTRARSS
jgi:hypothetical protein